MDSHESWFYWFFNWIQRQLSRWHEDLTLSLIVIIALLSWLQIRLTIRRLEILKENLSSERDVNDIIHKKKINWGVNEYQNHRTISFCASYPFSYCDIWNKPLMIIRWKLGQRRKHRISVADSPSTNKWKGISGSHILPVTALSRPKRTKFIASNWLQNMP